MKIIVVTVIYEGQNTIQYNTGRIPPVPGPGAGRAQPVWVERWKWEWGQWDAWPQWWGRDGVAAAPSAPGHHPRWTAEPC